MRALVSFIWIAVTGISIVKATTQVSGHKSILTVGQNLQQGSVSCIEGMFRNGTVCAECSRSCKTCVDEYTCSKCVLGYARQTVTDGNKEMTICEYQVTLAMLIILLVVAGTVSLVAILKVLCDRKRNVGVYVAYRREFEEESIDVAPIDADPPTSRREEATFTATTIQKNP